MSSLIGPAPVADRDPRIDDGELSDRAPAWLWPNLRKAATMIPVDPGTLSKHDVPFKQCGNEHRVPPSVVLKLAEHYGRRDLGEVGGELIEFARTQAKNRDELELLEDDVERYFASTRDTKQAEGDDAWLQEAKGYLPSHLYQRVLELAKADQREDLSFVGSTRFDD